jgi:hypothetical protein
MFFEYLRKWLVQQRLAAQNSEEIRPRTFGFSDNPVELFGLHPAVFLLSHDPTTLAIQVAVVGNGNEVEGWKKLAFLLPFLKPRKRHGAFYAHVGDELVQASPVAPD